MTHFHNVTMPVELLDENDIKKLPSEERFEKCKDTLMNSDDESKRWDAVWIVGELAENLSNDDPMFHKVADLIVWILKNDPNGVVKHEASFQIAARNMRDKIPALVDSALHDSSILAKHESIEALGLMRAYEAEPEIMKALNDESIDVRETAKFVLKRFDRLKATGDYVPSQIL